ncbi:MAG: hypothetical protein U0W24_07195 [Bacteroidales bacterium]
MVNSISNQYKLSNENAEHVLSDNGFKEAGLIVWTLTYKKTGYGHYKLSAELISCYSLKDTIVLNYVTTDSMLIDDWFEDNTTHYESAEAVMKTAFNIIIRNNREKLQSWIENLNCK